MTDRRCHNCVKFSNYRCTLDGTMIVSPYADKSHARDCKKYELRK